MFVLFFSFAFSYHFIKFSSVKRMSSEKIRAKSEELNLNWILSQIYTDAETNWIFTANTHAHRAYFCDSFLLFCFDIYLSIYLSLCHRNYTTSFLLYKSRYFYSIFIYSETSVYIPINGMKKEMVVFHFMWKMFLDVFFFSSFLSIHSDNTVSYRLLFFFLSSFFSLFAVVAVAMDFSCCRHHRCCYWKFFLSLLTLFFSFISNDISFCPRTIYIRSIGSNNMENVSILVFSFNTQENILHGTLKIQIQ